MFAFEYVAYKLMILCFIPLETFDCSVNGGHLQRPLSVFSLCGFAQYAKLEQSVHDQIK